MLSQKLPSLLQDEIYICHLTSARGDNFTVEAEGNGTTYTCNVALIGTLFQQLTTGTVNIRSIIVHGSCKHNLNKQYLIWGSFNQFIIFKDDFVGTSLKKDGGGRSYY